MILASFTPFYWADAQQWFATAGLGWIALPGLALVLWLSAIRLAQREGPQSVGVFPPMMIVALAVFPAVHQGQWIAIERGLVDNTTSAQRQLAQQINLVREARADELADQPVAERGTRIALTGLTLDDESIAAHIDTLAEQGELANLAQTMVNHQLSYGGESLVADFESASEQLDELVFGPFQELADERDAIEVELEEQREAVMSGLRERIGETFWEPYQDHREWWVRNTTEAAERFHRFFVEDFEHPDVCSGFRCGPSARHDARWEIRNNMARSSRQEGREYPDWETFCPSVNHCPISQQAIERELKDHLAGRWQERLSFYDNWADFELAGLSPEYATMEQMMGSEAITEAFRDHYRGHIRFPDDPDWRLNDVEALVYANTDYESFEQAAWSDISEELFDGRVSLTGAEDLDNFMAHPEVAELVGREIGMDPALVSQIDPQWDEADFREWVENDLGAMQTDQVLVAARDEAQSLADEREREVMGRNAARLAWVPTIGLVLSMTLITVTATRLGAAIGSLIGGRRAGRELAVVGAAIVLLVLTWPITSNWQAIQADIDEANTTPALLVTVFESYQGYWGNVSVSVHKTLPPLIL